VKLSVSLGDQDVEFLDEYASTHGVPSRSAVLARAVALLRANQLSDAYVDAWDEWAGSDESAAWESTVGDGLGRS
jgi:Arc/MetJ-type ribon-helix-helix transcriptional regulator